jgi:MFS family permease
VSQDTATTAGAVTPASIVRAYLVVSALFTLSASVIWGVNTLFLLDAGLDIFEVFVANAAFTAGMVLFEVPTGVVADTSGRRRSFLLSAATLTVGTLGYVAIAAAGGGLLLFVLASILLGLGFSFYSGAVEAWLVDALNATGHHGPLDRVFARGEMVSGAAMLVGSVGGGVLGSVDLAWPFLVRSLLLLAVLLVGLAAMHDVGFTPRATSLSALPSEVRRVLHTSLELGWRARPVRLLMLVSLVQGMFTVWSWYAWQAGAPASCAAQGLPVVASVDTLPRHPTPAAGTPHLAVPPSGDDRTAHLPGVATAAAAGGPRPRPVRPAGR